MSGLQSLLDKAVSVVQEHHSNQLITSVLHDADSHNWADDNEYFEVFISFRTAHEMSCNYH